ncbi:MAG: hypothetical protein V1678_03965, partial [Candidatus Aenigmatarchaeota archaeon]
MTKICIGMSVADFIRVKTVGTLIALFKAHPDMLFITKSGPYVFSNREQVVEDFLLTDCTHLFFVDSDMLFQPEVLDKLIADDKDIVGAQYNRRIEKENDPVVATRYQMNPGDQLPPKVFKNYAVATGCLLIKREVFNKIPKPWFFHGTAERPLGDDIFFCDVATKAGIEIF